MGFDDVRIRRNQDISEAIAEFDNPIILYALFSDSMRVRKVICEAFDFVSSGHKNIVSVVAIKCVVQKQDVLLTPLFVRVAQNATALSLLRSAPIDRS